MTKSLDESEVGISCYVSSLPGFRAVLKQRYSDFIVNEVDLDGNVVRLTSIDLQTECADEKAEETSSDLSKQSFANEIEQFRSLTGDSDADLLKEFLQKISASADDDLQPIILAPDIDKAHRAEVHYFFKTSFKFLVTDTVDGNEDSSKCIRVRFFSGEGAKGRRGKKRKDMENSQRTEHRPFDSRGADNWSEDRKFLRFHLYKENKDTQEALGIIGKMLGIQQRSFGFAGTKDKRAITTQRVTAFKLHPRRLAALNSRLFGIKVGDFCFVREGLVLGQLLGNKFSIILRGVLADSEDAVKAAADGLGRNGFINYYGLQRFGSGSVPTHLIGAALLRGHWKAAIDLILDSREGERSAIKEARKKYEQTGDADLMLRQLPHHMVAERAILQCLKKCPGNYLQALQAIPRTLRLMYVHSYQSYLWNHAASMRVKKHGITQIVLGDLVYCKENASEKVAPFERLGSEVNCDGDDNCNSSDVSDTSLPEEKVQQVKVINSNDILGGAYNLEDILLPLPGTRIIYPENDIADLYHNLSKKDGINLTESVHGVKEFSITNMTGAYRRVFQRPRDFTWELLTYTDDHKDLAGTDLDVVSIGKSVELIRDDSQNGVIASQIENCSSDSKVALKLEFTLPASCYATMAIRELLKSTSVAYRKMA
ncbi:tRNA pseudouridine13 synthase [Apostasia shenzhenica]|uniref:tRNA pseudouridine13 synthase n=1 Tax=Apostasia shenzhenica TaxID=1088818 RepID=A0A2I0BAY2_9ASPA|nr:tRNA pseudouridine13 synthase [Apostasia shenzhenica]